MEKNNSLAGKITGHKVWKFKPVNRKITGYTNWNFNPLTGKPVNLQVNGLNF